MNHSTPMINNSNSLINGNAIILRKNPLNLSNSGCKSTASKSKMWIHNSDKKIVHISRYIIILFHILNYCS